MADVRPRFTLLIDSRVVCALTACVIVACGPSAVTRHEHVVSGSVLLEPERYRAAKYDPNDPRLLRVSAELEALYGRPIVLRFAVEMMPRGEYYLDALFDSELGKLPQVMRGWKQNHSDAFAGMTAELAYIDFDYDGALSEPIAEFGKEPGRMRFVLNSWSIPSDLVQRAMASAHRRWQTHRYLERPVEQIPSSERLAYLQALIAEGADYFFVRARQNQGVDSSVTDEPSGGRSAVIVRTLRLAELAGVEAPKLTRALTERLLADGDYFRDCYVSHPEFVSRTPASSVWSLAAKQWLEWALRGLGTLPAEQRYELLETLMVPAQTSPRIARHERAFLGFDIVDFGFELLDDWSKAGHPTAAGQGQPAADATTRLYDRILCPLLPDERGFLVRNAQNCRPTLYATALADDQGRQRLLSEIRSAEDPKVRTLLSGNLIEMARSRWGMPKGSVVPSVLALLRQFEPHRAQWRELVRLLATEIDASDELREALYDQATRYYRERPEDRGVLLFLLARIDGYGRTPVAWQDFAPTYGSEISSSELATYLDQSYLAFEKFGSIVPALDGRESAGAVVASKLRGYLDSPWGRRDLIVRGSVLAGIGNELARVRDVDGLQRMRQELRAYIGSDPTRERQLRDTSERLSSLILSSGGQ